MCTENCFHNVCELFDGDPPYDFQPVNSAHISRKCVSLVLNQLSMNYLCNRYCLHGCRRTFPYLNVNILYEVRPIPRITAKMPVSGLDVLSFLTLFECEYIMTGGAEGRKRLRRIL